MIKQIYNVITLSSVIISFLLILVYTYGNVTALPAGGNPNNNLIILATYLYLISLPITLLLSRKELKWQAPYSIISLILLGFGLLVTGGFIYKAWIGAIRPFAYYIWIPTSLLLLIQSLLCLTKRD